MNIQAITFDVGGTLIEPFPSVGHVYAEVAEGHGLKGISPDILNERFKAAWRNSKSFHHTEADWAALVDETFGDLAPVPPSRSFFRDLYDRFAEPGAWRIYEDVVPALNGLVRTGLKLGVVSNWDERLRVLLQRLQLQDYFQVLVISCEVGFTKPSPAIFQRAASELGLPPKAILHLGDSLELDVQGATAAGFQALRVRRGAEQHPDDLLSLAELPAKLANRISAR